MNILRRRLLPVGMMANTPRHNIIPARKTTPMIIPRVLPSGSVAGVRGDARSLFLMFLLPVDGKLLVCCEIVGLELVRVTVL